MLEQGGNWTLQIFPCLAKPILLVLVFWVSAQEEFSKLFSVKNKQQQQQK